MARSRAKDNLYHKEWRRRFPLKEKTRLLRARYGITHEKLVEMYKAQQNKCAICERTLKRLNVDHDHKNNRVRGLLCTKCNQGLGHFNETPALFLRAIQYLQRY